MCECVCVCVCVCMHENDSVLCVCVWVCVCEFVHGCSGRKYKMAVCVLAVRRESESLLIWPVTEGPTAQRVCVYACTCVCVCVCVCMCVCVLLRERCRIVKGGRRSVSSRCPLLPLPGKRKGE